MIRVRNVVTTLALAAAFGCGKDDQRRDQRSAPRASTVAGTLEADAVAALGPDQRGLVFYWVDGEGREHKVDEQSLDAVGYRLTVPNEAIAPAGQRSTIETALGAGSPPPSAALAGEDAAASAVRVVLRPESAVAGEAPFLQFVAPVAAGTRAVQAAPVLRPAAVAFVSVTVSVPGASVALAPAGVDAAGQPVWATASARPIATTADAEGHALLYPVTAVEGLYQVVASAPGYCTRISDAFDGKTLASGSVAVSLRECAGSGLVVAPGKGETVYDESVGSILYTRRNRVLLDAGFAALRLSRFRVKLFEGLGITGAPVAVTEPDATLRSTLAVDLPVSFAGSGSPDGAFTIQVEALDGGETATVFGRRKVTPPAAPKAEMVHVLSPVGAEGVIPGTADGKFTVETDLCGQGVSIGLRRAAASDVVYAACEGTKASFTAAQLGLVGYDGAKGVVDLVAFIRDPYGNESHDEVYTRVNHIAVAVDLDAPADLGTAQLDFGFADGSGYGTEDAPVVVTRAALADGVVKFGFSEVSGQRYVPTAAREVVGDERLSGLSGFELSEVFFPEDAAQHAVYSVAGVDLAGLKGASKRVEIAPCARRPAGATICWQP